MDRREGSSPPWELARGMLACVVGVIMVAGCGPAGWQIDFVNDVGEPLVVRVEVGQVGRAWLVGADEGVTLFSQRTPVDGTIELLDPRSCRVLDRAELPARSTTFLVSTTPDGAEYMLVAASGGTEVPPVPANFDGCGLAPGLDG